MSGEFVVIPKERIETIRPLWEKLNELHLRDSTYFKDHFGTFTFQRRCEKFAAMDEGDVMIEVVEEDGKAVGYCISTMEQEKGEIDSLYVEEDYRRHGYGGRLVERSLRWLREKGCARIVVSVAEGHESVFGFYRAFGFYPRVTVLQLKG
ncbi:MAG: GNAT family N-acetyltransferase [Spirochaetes bacterium]|nr:GNAT family N-acetyltransferase [Spirochaetota bacterium]